MGPAPTLGEKIETLQRLSRANPQDGPILIAVINDLAGLAPVALTGRRPPWWSDIPVRDVVIGTYRQLELDAVVETIRERFGAERCPSRSSIHRVWQRLDRIPGRRR